MPALALALTLPDITDMAVTAPVLAGKYLLEDGTGGYQLEDGTGNILLD